MHMLRIIPLLLLIVNGLHAHVVLDYPTGGESLKLGDTVIIKFHVEEEHGPADLILYFSPDDGTTWEVIEDLIPMGSTEHEWVPNMVTENGLIRILQDNEEGTDYENISNAFTIEGTTTAVSDIEKSGIVDFSLTPNPLYQFATIQFGLKERSDVAIDVLSTNGSRIIEILNQNMSSGTHVINFDASAFPHGVVVCRIRTSKYMHSELFVHLE